MTIDGILASIAPGHIVPLFQPIVDVENVSPIGFEVLSRGPAPYASPLALFERARQLGLTWELERACRTAAFTAIAALPDDARMTTRFFINVSPDVIDDPRFFAGFTVASLESHGIAHGNIVIEITERATIRDYTQFENVIRHYAHQGFSIALDDFGAGHSGLITLISCTPHYLKLDMGVTRTIDRDPYKQMIVKSVVALAENVGATLIAEGVESQAELETLVRCGVRFAQGYWIARPSHRPKELDRDARFRLDTVARAARLPRFRAI